MSVLLASRNRRGLRKCLSDVKSGIGRDICITAGKSRTLSKSASSSAALSTAVSMLELMKEVGEESKAETRGNLTGSSSSSSTTRQVEQQLSRGIPRNPIEARSLPRECMRNQLPSPTSAWPVMEPASSNDSSNPKRRKLDTKSLGLPPPFCTCKENHRNSGGTEALRTQLTRNLSDSWTESNRGWSQSSGVDLLSVELLRRRNEEELLKQNCHFCGRCKHKQDRIVCKNPVRIMNTMYPINFFPHFKHCSLQGQRTKYICRACVQYQQDYFESIGVDWKNVLGDVNDPEW